MLLLIGKPIGKYKQAHTNKKIVKKSTHGVVDTINVIQHGQTGSHAVQFSSFMFLSLILERIIKFSWKDWSMVIPFDLYIPVVKSGSTIFVKPNIKFIVQTL